MADTLARSGETKFLMGGGDMGALMRGHDWSASPLGPPDTWPQPLRSVVSLLLGSKFPMFVAWGPELGFLYNDSYAEILGAKHPTALGRRFQDIWAEIWPDISPLIEAAMAGEATYSENLPLLMNRKGFVEQTWFTFSYSPVRNENGRVAGMFCACTETTGQVLAERNLRESEARARGVLEGMAEGFVLLDHDFKVLDINPEGLRLEPRGRDAILGKSHWEAWPGSEEAEIGRLYKRAMAERVPVSLDHRYVWPDGSSAWLEMRCYPSENGLAVFYRDVTERKRDEERLRHSEEQLRLATEAAEIGLWDLNPATDTLFWPPRVKAMFGISADKPISMSDFFAGLHPEDAQATSDAFAAAVDPTKRALYDVEYRTIGKEDGLVRWVAAKGRGLFDVENSCTRVIGTAIDITGRKAIEEQLHELNEQLEARVAERTAELRESERRFRGIFDSALQFMALLSPDGTVVEVNRSALAWSEIEPGDIVGRPFWLAAPMRDNPALQAAIETGIRRAAAGETVREEHEMRGAGEVRAVVDFSLKPVNGNRGQPIWLVAEGRDITDLKRAQDALRQAQKMEAVGQLTGGLAHDFNNLLGAVVGSFDLIRRKPTEVEKVKRWAENGMAAAERGAKLTAQLLAFARAQRLEKKPVVIADLLDGMRDLLERTLGPMVRLKLDLAGSGAALSDPTQLEMAVLNLAINARDAMPDSGELTIATATRRIEGDAELGPGDYVEIAVTDTGAGMPPDVIARAFDPFFTTKGVGKGTGLGLSQVYGVARQTGGTVRIESSPGAGTTVRILLPGTVALPEDERITSDYGDAGTVPTATVLVVDDDPDIRRVLVELLDLLGYGVIEASDGPSGLVELERSRPDLMMVDFAMPGMNGAEVAKAAREQWPDLPIVFASGYADTKAIEDAAGPQALVLRKPFRVDELQAVLAAALKD